VSATEIAVFGRGAGLIRDADEYLLCSPRRWPRWAWRQNLSSEEAATALAQLANIMQTSGNDYERMGSSIVALGIPPRRRRKTSSSCRSGWRRGARRRAHERGAGIWLRRGAFFVGIEAEAGRQRALQKSGPTLKRWSQRAARIWRNGPTLQGMSAAQFAEAVGKRRERRVFGIY
jgi:hypothetical protein